MSINPANPTSMASFTARARAVATPYPRKRSGP